MLTNGLKGNALVTQSQGFGAASEKVTDPSAMQQLLAQFPEVAKVLAQYGQDAAAGEIALLNAVREAMAPAFANSFWVAAFLVALTLIPAYFLPRDHEESQLLEDVEDADLPTQVFIH